MSYCKEREPTAQSRYADPARAVEDDTHEPIERYQRPHRKGWFQWIPTDRGQLRATECAMLVHLRSPYQQRTIAGLNTITLTARAAAAGGSTTSSQAHHVLFLHGFGGGLAAWLPNLDPLVAELALAPFASPCYVHAVDMPGFARSDRTWRNFVDDKKAMSFMTESLLAWCGEMGISPESSRLDIIGHSFGGYIAAQFALQHPERVSHLFLADPWGVPICDESEWKNRRIPIRFRIGLALYRFGLPLWVLRAVGPMGPRLLPRFRPDFAERWKPHIDDVNKFFDYTYHCNADRNALGEHAFQMCGRHDIPVYARQPLAAHLPAGLSVNVQLTVAYGENTWMRRDAGERMVQQMQRAAPEASRAIHIISEAGHQINTDNAPDFNRLLIAVIVRDPFASPHHSN